MLIPIAAATQIILAVVSPFIEASSLKITPAPKKPIPLTIYEAIRVVSVLVTRPILYDIIVNKVEPSEIIVMVRKPAALSFISRSKPKITPKVNENRALNTSMLSQFLEKTVKLTTTFQSKLTIDFGAN